MLLPVCVRRDKAGVRWEREMSKLALVGFEQLGVWWCYCFQDREEKMCGHDFRLHLAKYWSVFKVDQT